MARDETTTDRRHEREKRGRETRMKDHPPIKGMSRTPFPFGWYAWELGEFRPFPRQYLNYWLFPYETLPPLPPPDPSFSFLAPHDDTLTPDPALEASRV